MHESKPLSLHQGYVKMKGRRNETVKKKKKKKKEKKKKKGKESEAAK